MSSSVNALIQKQLLCRVIRKCQRRPAGRLAANVRITQAEFRGVWHLPTSPHRADVLFKRVQRLLYTKHPWQPTHRVPREPLTGGPTTNGACRQWKGKDIV